MQRQGILQRYATRLPQVTANGATPLSLGEGGTPLLALQNLPAALDLPAGIRLWVKYEGLNPTGSFKDRGMVVAVAAAVMRGARCVLCASTGNTSAAAAAYAGRARLPCIVLIPQGKVAAGKIAQAVAHGATIVQIDGNFDDAMTVVRAFNDDGVAAVVNSINPMRLQGQKTAAFEVIETLGSAPTYHALPVGNAGNITAHWIGYSEAAGKGTPACLHCGGNCDFAVASSSATAATPVMLGYQAAGSAPFIHGCPVDKPETVATAIRIGNPQSYAQAKTVIADSGGWMSAVSDDDILRMQRLLAAEEGIFCEPASASSVAGVVGDIKSGKIKSDTHKGDVRIVCTLTGHGLKDPDVFPLPPIQTTAVADLPALIRRIVNEKN